ncbi:hypothetical protein GF389_04785 [Candidatus Dojkabacteria bacterium]|nr:hypothetical protein [Candidatus Dojkabacteria bacterium]
MVIDNKKLKKLLSKYKAATEKQINEAFKKAEKEGKGIDQILIDKKQITKDQLGEIIAKEYKVPYTNLTEDPPETSLIVDIPEEIARKYYVLLLSKTPKKVTVTTDAPDQKDLKEELENLFTDKNILLTYSLPQDIESFFKYYSQTSKTDQPKPKVVKRQGGIITRLFGNKKNDEASAKQEEQEVSLKEKLESSRINNKNLRRILEKGKYVNLEELEKAYEYVTANDETLDQHLIEKGLITADIIGQAIAESYKVPYADLNSNTPGDQQILRIPKEIATRYYAILYEENGDKMSVATDNPEQRGLMDDLKRLFPDKKISLHYALARDIEKLLVAYRDDLSKRIRDAQKSTDRPAIAMLKEILDEAVTMKASDIHLEPEEDRVFIRYRIDGVMQEFGKIDFQYYSNILNRIKVKSKLRIDEHFKAQDGSMVFGKDEREMNIRVSIAPTLNGEKVVMRLLAKYVQGFALSDIGLRNEDEETLRETSKSPFGMILVTGPTGSGKTTTLYSVLKILNKRDVNITTIEDPVEYRIKGVNQIQVNNETGLTFAKGLRSIVRQDPDIILVGEIRDEETAEIGVNAALTGHLLLSTFHSNDAATAIPRLLDMNIEPFLLSSTLEMVIAQRLVRKICNKCKMSYTLSATEAKKHKHLGKGKTTLYKGEGCTTCNNSGYVGRTAIFEIIDISKTMKELILTNPSSQEVWELAKKQGSKSLYEDGIAKVKNGITTIEELNRVASPTEQ